MDKSLKLRGLSISWRKVLLAWLVFVFGIGAVFGADYAVRLAKPPVERAHNWTGMDPVGLPWVVYAGLQVVVVVISTVLVVKAVWGPSHQWVRALVIAVQLIAGFFALAFGGLLYVVGTGVDSL